ncbi:ThiF family adenylyltransferase [Pedobacter panaciterrae]
MLYSDSLSPYSGSLRPAVLEAVEKIKLYFGDNGPEVYIYDEWNIVVKGSYKVPLPEGGAVGNLDIRAEEAVLIKLSLLRYPDLAPSIYSDRLDFPKQKLAHLYLSKPGRPAPLCLVRDKPSDWFAGVKLEDFLQVGLHWFYKAGAGLLDTDGGEFDPIRIEGGANGWHIYSYDMAYDVVSNDRRLIPEEPMALCLAGELTEGIKGINYKSIEAIPFLSLPEFREKLQKFHKENRFNPQNQDTPLFSVLLWHPEGLVEPDYLVELPSTYNDLKCFFEQRSIDLKGILAKLDAGKVLFTTGLPIVYAMKRPKKLIGYNGDYEFLNFVVVPSVKGIQKTPGSSKVFIQLHSEPFTTTMASEISGHVSDSKSLYIGAGSLGSKMIMHDARSGNKQIAVVDDDSFLSHNLARHILLSQDVGKNKAEAVVEKIKGFYNTEVTPELNAITNNVVFVAPSDVSDYNLIIDTTASQMVRNHLVTRSLNSCTRYIKAEVADEGHLGLLYMEGADRNPRMDDLNYLVCYLGKENVRIREWRMADVSRSTTTLNIGLGCSSATSIVADDLLSFHASFFTRILMKGNFTEANEGTIRISVFDDGADGGIISQESFSIGRFEILECLNNSGWQVRLFPGLAEALLKLTNEHSPVETGGVLIGVANYKLKTIYVFEIVPAPPDSKASTARFQRGILGLPKAIDDIKRQTGEVIGYVGEWHSHPMNLERLSSIDLDTIDRLKVINSAVPIPTCAIVVTKDKILPFVFE